ncbi:MAG: Rpn family recombination-promoting nuclease/putative transposase [Pseudomonadota bacterium]
MKLAHGRLLDPKADLVFKKIFGCNKDLIKSFLNGLLPLADDELIDTVEYLTPEQVPVTPLQKYSIVDVRCCDQKGRIFIVEMQMGWSPSFMSRLQFGTAKSYVSQLGKGFAYEQLNSVYGLSLVGEIFDPNTDEWYHHYKTVNMVDTRKQIPGMEMIFVELPKFKTTTHWEKKLGILWLRFLNEIADMKDIPQEFIDVPEISKAIELTQEASFSKEELAGYDGYWDRVSVEKTVKSDAERKGKAEGKAEGLAEGKAEVVLKMLAKNFDDETILECSGLTRNALAALKKSFGMAI